MPRACNRPEAPERRRRRAHRDARRAPLARLRRRLRGAAGRALAASLAAQLVALPAAAGPSGERVVSGSADVVRQGAHTDVRVSDGGIIAWDRFDIGSHESVRFLQPHEQARVLNRVTGDGASQIHGLLQANGHVYIANPAGVFFGESAVVDVGRLVAAGGRLGDDDFLAGRDRFTELRGEVVNAGAIRAGDVALVGRRVANHGRIHAPDGAIVLAAGDRVFVGEHGSHVLVEVDPDGGAAASAEGAPAVENTGELDAGRGSARLAAGDLLALGIRQKGRVRARDIALEAGEGSRVEVSGQLDASAPEPGGRGGRIHVLGGEIALRGAELDASGAAGGGRIRVGGDVMGTGELQRARTAWVDRESVVRADATAGGDGGSVVVFAEDGTVVDGLLSARGAGGGRGGFVETSGLAYFDITRTPEVGAGGTWLIDPRNIVIADSEVTPGEEVLDDSEGAQRDPALFQSDREGDGATAARISSDAIEGALRDGTDVVVTTERFLQAGAQEGDITVASPIVIADDPDVATARASLTLFASDDIFVDADIDNQSSALTLDLNLLANDNERMPFSDFFNAGLPQPELGQAAQGITNNPNTQRGDLQVAPGVSLRTGGGDLALQGVDVDLAAGGSIETGGGTLSLLAFNPVFPDDPSGEPLGSASLAKTMDTGGGAVSIVARDEVVLDAALTTGDGSVELSGTRVTVGAAGSVLGGDSLLRLGRGSQALGTGEVPETAELTLQGPVATEGGGSVQLIGEDLSLESFVESAEGDVFASARTITATANDDDLGDANDLSGVSAPEGLVALAASEQFDVASGGAGLGIAFRGDAVDLSAGSGVAAAEDTSDGDLGSLLLDDGSVEIAGREVTLRAGDGFTADDPDDPIPAGDARRNARIDLSALDALAGADGAATPERLSLVQDGTLVDDGTPAGGVPDALADASGVELLLESADDRVELGTGFDAAEVAGADLTLAGRLTSLVRDPAGAATAISPASLEVRAREELQVTDLDAAGSRLEADHLRPTDELVLHGGAGGTGGLALTPVADADVDLVADRITLRAGDGPGGGGFDAALTGVASATFADATGAANPQALSLRQDASLADADLPAPAAYQDGSPAGVALSLRSDDGSVELVDPAAVAGADLAVASALGIDVASRLGDFSVASLDLGGVSSFTATQELLDAFAVDDGGRVTLRAALSGTGSLSFQTGAVVSADEIVLEAVADEPGTGGGRVALPAADPLAPAFQGDGDPLGLFALRQDAAITDDELPSLDLFGGTAPDVVALRSEDPSGGVTFQDFSAQTAPVGGGSTLLLAGANVVLERRTGALADGEPAPDLDFTALDGEVVVQADDVTLAASRSEDVEDQAVAVDASQNLRLAGFDAESEPDYATTGLDGSPASLTVRQEADLPAAALPAAGAYADGTDGVAILLESLRGGIDLDDPSRVAGSDLTLRTPVLAADDTAAPVGGGLSERRIELAGDFSLGSLVVQSARELRVQGATVNQTGDAAASIRLQGAQDGESTTQEAIDAGTNVCELGEGLCFGSGVTLRAEVIELSAGDGTLEAEDSAPAVANANRTAPQFVFADDGEPDAEGDQTAFRIEQDGRVDGSTLPEVGQIAEESGTDLDLFRALSAEDDVVLEGLARVGVASEVELQSLAQDEDAPGQIRVEEAGSFDPAALGITRLALGGQEIVLESGGEAVLRGDVVRLQGAGGEFTAPEALTVEQAAAVADDSDAVPDRSQYGADPGALRFRLASTGGGVLFGDDLAGRLVGSDLGLEGQGDVEIALSEDAVDVDEGVYELAGLSVDSGGGSVVLGTEDDGSDDLAALPLRTTGDQSYTGAGGVVLASDVRLDGSSVSFGGAVEAQSGAEGLWVEADDTVRFDADVGLSTALSTLDVTLRPGSGASPRMLLGPDDAAGTVLAVRTQGDLRVTREGISPIATVARPEGDLVLESVDGDIRLGEGGKLSVDGDVSLVASAAGAEVEVSDVTTTGTFSVTAPDGTLLLRRRGDGTLLRSDGARVEDAGLDIAANDLDWQVAAVELSGSGRRPVFGVPDPFDLPDELVAPGGGPRFAVAALFDDFRPLAGGDLVFEGTTLDVRPEGPGRTDPSTGYPIVPPLPETPEPGTPRLGGEDPRLREVGITLRELDPSEVGDLVSGAGIIDDARPLQQPLRVAPPRLRVEAALEAAAIHRRVFGPGQDQTRAIRDILQEALDQYQRETRTRRVAGFELRRYVKNRPSSLFAAHQVLEDLDRLFRQHRSSGLAPAEYRRVQSDWLARIQPEGISLDELAEAIHPSRYVRGSDILDIFGE